MALCSDAVIVLLAVMQRAGYEARMLDIGGHVIASVTRGGREWIADPDYKLVFEGSLSEFERADSVARLESAILDAGHPPSRAEA